MNNNMMAWSDPEVHGSDYRGKVQIIQIKKTWNALLRNEWTIYKYSLTEANKDEM